VLEETVYIPVPAEWAGQVHQLLARLYRGEAVELADPKQAAAAPRRELDQDLAFEMYRDSGESHRELIRYLAENPGQWFSTSVLAERLGLQHGAKGLAGLLGAFGRRANHRYGGVAPWESVWDSVAAEARHQMLPEVARWMQAAADQLD
jgi:hypothetical protein